MADAPVWIIREVESHGDHTLLLFFANGERRIFDARPLLEKPYYRKLKSLTYFLKAKLDYGTVVWNNDIDIAPEYLYQHSKPE